MPADGRWAAVPLSHPSSCQRTRSAMTPADAPAMDLIETPQPLEPLTVLGLGDDQHTGTGMAARRETVVELSGQRAPDERGGVDPFCGRVELGFDRVLRRQRARVGRPFVESRRQPMRERAVVAEASEHVGGRQRGEITERAQTEPAQHVDEVGTIERVER